MTATQNQQISIFKTLNGMSIAIAIALLPGALLGELANYINTFNPIGAKILFIINFCTSMLPITIGICIALQHNLDTIQTLSVGFSSILGSGVIKSVENGMYKIAGTGDVINTGFTAFIATWMIMTFCRHFKSMSVLVTPTVIPLIAGSIGLFFLPYVSIIATSIGETINYFTTLHPILMGSLIAMSFTTIIVSPISTVGISFAIGISGIAAAAANTGVSVAAVVLAILSYKTNPLGTVLAHIFGTPKMQMVNFVKKPIIIFPCLLISGLLGMIAGFAHFEMPTKAAGFGIIGGIGPIALMNHLGWSFYSLVFMVTYFFIIPFSSGLFLQYLGKKYNLIQDNDYKLKY